MIDKIRKILDDPRNNLRISFVMSLILGAVLWLKSDAPPYGWPKNELNEASWGILADIAREWRSGELPFWHGIAGGTSLYTGGFYPILHPLNFLAWFLNDDQFFLFNLVGPYSLGFFLGCLLLREIFGLRWPAVFFGAFYYMGLAVGRFFLLANGPYYLWGVALFPGMVYAYYKLRDKNIVLACAAVGVILAWQFSAIGLMHFLPDLVWWFLFLFVESVRETPAKHFPKCLKKWAVCFGVLVAMNIGIFGVQFVPTALFSATESARIPYYYPINNFPLIILNPPTEGGFNPDLTLFGLLYSTFINSVGASMRGIASLALICLALWLVNRRKTFQNERTSGLGALWVAMISYCLLTTVVDIFVKLIPVIKPLFISFTRFTLGYGIHTLDLCMAVTFAVILNNSALKITQPASPGRKFLAWAAVGLAAASVALPIITHYPPLKEYLHASQNFFRIFTPENFKTAAAVLVLTIVIGVQILWRPKNKIFSAAAAVCLVFLAFMVTTTSYNWNNKGRRFMFERFLWDSPEHQYFRQAKGKYFIEYDLPEFTAGNFNLLRGVRGPRSYSPVPPYRLRRYMAGERFYTVPYWSGNGTSLSERPQWKTISYFPVDFTMIKKGETLPWKGFHKEISGEKFDVWVSDQPPKKVRFAERLHILPVRKAVKTLDTRAQDQLGGAIFITKGDARKFSLSEVHLRKGRVAPQYSAFERKRDDRVRFHVSSPNETFVIFPEMFQKGWRVTVNGQETPPFPAYYLFIGFQVPAGESVVEMTFTPPGLGLGALVSFLSLWIFWALIRHRKDKIPL